MRDLFKFFRRKPRMDQHARFKVALADQIRAAQRFDQHSDLLLTCFEADNTFRVDTSDHKKVVVVSFGMLPSGLALEGVYSGVDELPPWMRAKLAVLRTLHCPPPSSEVPTVGRRMGEELFWVYGD